jgi:large subunit ribosomal protein L25
VNLTIEDTGETRLALIQDVQHNPLTGAIIHLDFHAISENERIHANIPLELVGDAAGVKAGGLLEHLVHKLEVQCLPKDLPEIIRVDVSGIEVGKALHLREIPLPEGVRASADGELIVALVSEPRVAEPTPAEAAPAKDAKGAKGGKAKK